MFRLHKSKHSSVKPAGDKFNFKFSEFEAIQVPKGWDKLLVSIMSVETGKTLAKTSKAVVKNGNCQWTDSVSDSIWIPTKENQSHSSKQLEDCPYKFVVFMGSGRSGILGEAVVNTAIYMSSSDSFPVSFPLNKCSHGTILQLKIQCLTPRIMDNGSKLTNEDHNITSSNGTEIKSGDSDNTLIQSAKSYSSKDLTSNSHEEHDEKGGAKGAPEHHDSNSSRHSYNSAESFIETESSDGIDNKHIVTQHSTTLQNSVPPGSAPSENFSQDFPQEFSRISGSSKSLLEAAEDTIEDLHSEAKRWERNARKLKVDLEILRKQCSELSKSEVDLGMELSATRVERNCLLKEVEHLNQLLEKASQLEDLVVQDNGLANVVKGLEDEIRLLKEENGNLSQQCYWIQESNFELISALQELEETMENKKAEIDIFQGKVDKNQGLSLQVQQLQESEKNLREKIQELEKELQGKSQNVSGLESNENLIKENESLKAKLQELESDCQELTDENLELLLKLKDMKKNSDEDGIFISFRPDDIHNESKIHELEEKIASLETDHSLEVQVLEGKIEELNKELSGKKATVDILEADLVLKENEIGNLLTFQVELEEKLCTLRNEKEIVEIATREAKSSELEDGKRELEIRLSELKQENEELSDCVSMLEAQIRNLTDDRKSIALELDNTRSNSLTLQDEIARLRNEMQIQETTARQNLDEMSQQRSEYQEEAEYLRNEKTKQEATTECLMKNCGSLQNTVRQLRMDNLELQKNCDALDAKLTEVERNYSVCSKKANDLQQDICKLMEETTTKEQILTSELDTLVKENDGQSKKLYVLDQMYTEKSEELGNLRQELKNLNKEICETRDEKQKLLADISKLETELKTIQIQSKVSIEDLVDELASSKQNQEMLKTEMAKMSNLLESCRSSEEIFKTKVNSLESKLTVSEYEHKQLTKETVKLKGNLVKLEPLEIEVVSLRNEKQKLESLLTEKSEECKEVKIEKNSCIEKITELQKKFAEMEDCRNDKFELEERIQQLESSLIANEGVCDQDTELRKELSRILISNKQFQQQIQQLQEEKQKFKARIKSLEEEKQRNFKGSNSFNSYDYQYRREGDEEFSKSRESNIAYKAQLKRMASENIRSRIRVPRHSKGDGEFVAKEKFERTKSSLETELRELQERYLDMSLKYAQVEAQREELVMKLKGHSNGRRCF